MDGPIKIRMIMFVCSLINKKHPEFPVGTIYYFFENGSMHLGIYLGNGAWKTAT